MIKVIKDLTPMLREMEARDAADPRPWYEKHWPYMKHGQRIKIISAPGGMLEGKEMLAERITAKFIAFLAPRVNYDLKEKLFVVEEVIAEQEPDEYLCEEKTHAKLRWFKDHQGEIIPSEQQFDRAERGEYLLALIDLFTSNWPRFSVRFLEEILAHELLHVANPRLGFCVKNGFLMENERIMEKATNKLLRETKR